MGISLIVIVVIVTALAFDFTNGFHDTANAMATSIATGALKPKVAVLISGVLNIGGAFLSVEVAKTISSGLVDETKVAWIVTLPAAAVVGAVAAFAASQGAIGTVLVALVAIAIAVGIYAASRRTPVTADNVNDVEAPIASDEVRTESGVAQA